jgi:hypothetical protein
MTKTLMTKKTFTNKKILLLALSILFTGLFSIKAQQHSVGIKIYGGLTKMRYVSNSYISLSFIELDIKEPIMLQPNGGFYYNYHLSNDILFGFEILYSQVQYVEQIKMTYINSNDYIHTDNILNFTYLGFPIYAGRKSEKFSANVGLMPLILLKDNWRAKGEAMINDTLNIADEKYNLNIDKFDIGIRLGFVYDIYKRFHIESNFYMGINNLFVKDDKETKGEYLYNQQLTIGLRYDIFK